MSRTRPHITRRTAALAAALAMLLVAAPSAGAVEKSGSDSVGFGASPLQFDLNTKPGASSTHTITISNSDSTSTRFTFSKEDFAGDRDDPGATPVMLGGKFDSAISGYDWIELPDPVTVPGGQSRAVKVKVTAPSGATGAHYAALVIHGEARSAGQIIATSRLAVLFMMNAGGVPPPEIVITEIQEVGPTTTVTKIVNKGSTPVRNPKPILNRNPLGPGGDREVVGECKPSIVIPGASAECVVEDPEGGSDGAFGGNGPVEQSLTVVGDGGGDETSARGELPTEWAGAWTSLLLPLVGVALFVLYFLFLRRRRKREEGDEGDLAWSGPGLS